MSIFDSVRKGLKKFTLPGQLGLFDNNSVNYNDLFASQSAIYQQQIAERNRLANAADITNSNLAATTILTGGSKPIETGPKSNDLSARTASDAAVKEGSTEGLTGDSLALQQQRNKEAMDAWLKQVRMAGDGSISGNNFIGGS